MVRLIVTTMSAREVAAFDAEPWWTEAQISRQLTLVGPDSLGRCDIRLFCHGVELRAARVAAGCVQPWAITIHHHGVDAWPSHRDYLAGPHGENLERRNGQMFEYADWT